MQGKLKSITLNTSQETWKLDLPHTPVQAAPGAQGQPQGPPPRVPITTTRIAPQVAEQPVPVRNNQKRAASISEARQEDDDDAFMPPAKQHACPRASSSRIPANIPRRAPGESAPLKLPAMRCVPSFFRKLCEHITMEQRRIIINLDFGGLLQFSTESPDTTDLLVFLMDKLNPETMTLEVGDEGGLKIHDFCVNKVLAVPLGKNDPPCSTEEENECALVKFRRYVHVESNKDVKCKHLLDLISKLAIDDALAVRIFFVVAFNKLLFPATDNNIRGRDAFSMMDVSDFANINWCKAVIDELRLAAIIWRSEKKRSIPGCAIFLIIFYLDNLNSQSSINHFITPCANFFNKIVMERLIREDRRRDRDGRLTFGNLQLRNRADTCYQFVRPTSSDPSPAATSRSALLYPRAEELGALFSEMTNSSSRDKVAYGLERFDIKASEALSLIQSGSEMFMQAHKEFINDMWNALGKAPAGNSSDTRDKGHAVENHSSSSEEFSFMRSGAATDPQTHASPSLFFGHEQCTEQSAGTRVEHDDSAQQLQGDIQHTEFDTNSINRDHGDEVQDYTPESYMASIDHIIPAAAAEGYSMPISHMHTSTSGISNDGSMGGILHLWCISLEYSVMVPF